MAGRSGTTMPSQVSVPHVMVGAPPLPPLPSAPLLPDAPPAPDPLEPEAPPTPADPAVAPVGSSSSLQAARLALPHTSNPKTAEIPKDFKCIVYLNRQPTPSSMKKSGARTDAMAGDG